jgi:putative membrane protein
MPDGALRTYVIGLCMGSADAVPGVSGGTIALIAGIYDRLIDAITDITPASLFRILRSLVPPMDRDDAWAELDRIDLPFLVVLGLGIVTAIVLVSRAVHFADTHYPVLLFGFFFGLIGASAVVIGRQVSLAGTRHLGAAVAGFLIAFGLSGDLTILAAHSLPLTLLAGAIAISAMILPGISGSLMLVILGQYTFLSGTLSTFTGRLAGLLTGGPVSSLIEPGTTVVAFIVGAVVGLVTISRVVHRALEADRQTTLVFLVALVVGSLRAPIVVIGVRKGIPWTGETITQFAAIAVVGALVLFALDRYAVDIEADGMDH